MTFVRQHSGAVVWSLALHIAVVVGIMIGIPWPDRQRAPLAAPTVAIEGVIIDQAAIEREKTAREEVVRQERQRVQREERERREVVEKQRLADEREQQRVTDARRAKELNEQKERDRVAAEKREQDRVAKEKSEREAREKVEREAAAKREREAAEQRRRQQQAESELQQQLALEVERNNARAAGLYDQYVLMIENRIRQHWDRPLSARSGIDCVVHVVQLPTGDVIEARVSSCNGDDAVRRSIERAVMDASPLPKAPTPALFERNLNVNFRPDE